MQLAAATPDEGVLSKRRRIWLNWSRKASSREGMIKNLRRRNGISWIMGEQILLHWTRPDGMRQWLPLGSAEDVTEKLGWRREKVASELLRAWLGSPSPPPQKSGGSSFYPLRFN
jgi:hypothetical protein